MPVAAMCDILNSASHHRYGIGAFNVVDALTMETVIEAAAETHSPVIVQISVKTVRRLGAGWGSVLFDGSSLPYEENLELDRFEFAFHGNAVGTGQGHYFACWHAVHRDRERLYRR